MTAHSHSFPIAVDRIALARTMAAHLLLYADLLDKGKRQGSEAVQFERLKWLDAGIALEDDGNLMESRDTLLDEMQWDENGNPDRSSRETDQYWRDSWHAINAGLGE